MRRKLLLLLALAALAAGFGGRADAKTTDEPAAVETPGAPATSAKVEEVFARFGLFGTWARACKDKATPANPHVAITTKSSPGLVVEDQDLGAGYAVNRYNVVAAQALSQTRLAVEAIFQPGTPDEEHQWLIYEVRGDTRRTLFNRADNGAVRVKDGMVLAAHRRTPVLHKCE